MTEAGFSQERQDIDRSRDWWQRPLVQLFALPVAMVLALAVLMLFYNDTVVAAQWAGIPKKMLSRFAAAPEAPPEPEPFLQPGENWRWGTTYPGTTTAVEVKPEERHQGFLVLVNYDRLLPEDYLPESLTVANDLVEAANPPGFAVTKSQLAINSYAAEKLLAMVAHAQAQDGITGYMLVSGHRDFSYQTGLYQRKVAQYRSMGYGESEAKSRAAVWVARPKESEHHTGLAMDVSSRSHPSLETSYYQTDNGFWLDEHCWSFGFLIRYPEDKTEITQIGYEPWHLRYVGRPHSDFIRLQRWCLEEYHAALEEYGGLTYRDEGGGIWQITWQPEVAGKIMVPSDRAYTLSGTGAEGFIITVLLEETRTDGGVGKD